MPSTRGAIASIPLPAGSAGVASAAAPDVYDVLIVGAGPAGISASLRAIEKKLNYLTVDEGEIGGTVAKYPRQKLVMTSPVEFPLVREIQEDRTVEGRADCVLAKGPAARRISISARARKSRIFRRRATDIFTVMTSRGQYRARAVVLAHRQEPAARASSGSRERICPR